MRWLCVLLLLVAAGIAHAMPVPKDIDQLCSAADLAGVFAVIDIGPRKVTNLGDDVLTEYEVTLAVNRVFKMTDHLQKESKVLRDGIHTVGSEHSRPKPGQAMYPYEVGERFIGFYSLLPPPDHRPNRPAKPPILFAPVWWNAIMPDDEHETVIYQKCNMMY